MNQKRTWSAVVLATDIETGTDGLAFSSKKAAGLSVLTRIIKSMAFEGASELFLVTHPGNHELSEEARRAWPKDEGFHILEQTEKLKDTDILSSLASNETTEMVVVYADLSFSKNLLQALLGDRKDHLEAYVAVKPTNRIQASMKHPYPATKQQYAGISWMKAEFARTLPASHHLDDVFDSLREDQRIGFRQLENSHAMRVRNSRDLTSAGRLQIQALRRNTDGLVSQYLNRPISLRLCRYIFLPLDLKPNHITILAALIGWVGIALVVGWHGYVGVLLGSFLFHVSSILDGCDGEIARLKFQFSRFGEWLDNVLDEINNTLFIAGIGIGAYLQGADVFLVWAATFYILAIATCNSAVFYQLATWRGKTGNVEKFRWFFEKETQESPKNPTAYPERRTISDWLRDLPRRDFYIFLFFLLALVDHILLGFWLAVGLSVVLFILGILQWVYQLRPCPYKTHNLSKNHPGA